MSRAWYSLRNWSGGATPDHAQRKMLCKWFSSSLSFWGEIRGAPLCQFISLTHHVLFITRIWFPKPVAFFSLKMPLTIWSWGLIFDDDDDYDYYYYRYVGREGFWATAKPKLLNIWIISVFVLFWHFLHLMLMVWLWLVQIHLWSPVGLIPGAFWLCCNSVHGSS